MRILALIFLALLQQETKLEDFTAFKKGTTWKYDTKRGKNDVLMVRTVREVKGGRLHIDVHEYDKGKEDQKPVLTQEEMILGEKNHLFTGRWTEGDKRDGLRIWKAGSKKGDSWVANPGEKEMPMKATHQGVVEVKVPAGVYKNAEHVKLTVDVGATEKSNMVIDVYLVPKVGIVKMTAKDGENFLYSAVLREFKKGE